MSIKIMHVALCCQLKYICYNSSVRSHNFPLVFVCVQLWEYSLNTAVKLILLQWCRGCSWLQGVRVGWGWGGAGRGKDKKRGRNQIRPITITMSKLWHHFHYQRKCADWTGQRFQTHLWLAPGKLWWHFPRCCLQNRCIVLRRKRLLSL